MKEVRKVTISSDTDSANQNIDFNNSQQQATVGNINRFNNLKMVGSHKKN